MPVESVDNAQKIRGGYCAIVGRANVGKSTLLNRLIGARIAPTSGKPQTTRQIIRGILTAPGTQIVFIDTPGIHLEETHLLNTAMNRSAAAALDEADVVVFVIEIDDWREEEDRILEMLRAANKPCLLCINKTDRLREKQGLLPMLAYFRDKFPFDALIPISATQGDNLTALIAEIRERLPRTSGYLFPEEQLSDQNERFITEELIREQLMRHLEKELPYSVYVETETFEERAEAVWIAATIWVARDSHKAIVIGRSGRMLKQIGSRARVAIEQFLGRRCHLKLWVKVKPDWQDDPRIVRKLTA